MPVVHGADVLGMGIDACREAGMKGVWCTSVRRLVRRIKRFVTIHYEKKVLYKCRNTYIWSPNPYKM